jgi:hypothetical protein
MVVGVTAVRRRPLASVQAPPGGHADRTRCRRVGKGHALCNQAIQVRRADDRIAQGADCVKALLIGVNEKDIWPICHSLPPDSRRHSLYNTSQKTV